MALSAAAISAHALSAGQSSAPEALPIALPLRLSVLSAIPIGLPVRLSVSAVPAIALPLRLSVGAGGAAVALPLRLSVLDAAVRGGLDGAGAWAAAPDGKWRAHVWLGDTDISARITGAVSVTHADNAAATADFGFLPASTHQPMSIIGQRVRIAFAQASGANAQTIFTGVVDVPSIDLQSGVVSCSCKDQAQEVWANTPRPVIDAMVGGRWHVAVSGEPEDNFAYLEERIQSVGKSWAIDALGQIRIIPWRGLSRSVTVRQADVIDGSLSVDLPSRDQLRTRIVCRMQYRYTLLRSRGARLQWSEPLEFFQPRYMFGTQLKPGYLLCTRPMVEQATESVSGWGMVSREIISPPWGTWNVGTELDPFLWTITATVAPTLAVAVQADYATRWQQSITEDYTVEVVWGALESQLPAPIPEEIGASLEAEFDVRDWGSDSSVAPALPTAVGDYALPWQPAGADTSARDEALRTLLDRAWVRLWDASRSGRVRFDLPCRPDLWLDAGVTLETARVRASGKVVEVQHLLDMESGEATTSVSVAVGMPGATDATQPDWTLPAAPADDYTPPVSAYSFECGTFVGGLAESPPYDEAAMVGFLTNAEGADGANEQYPHSFRLRDPGLAAEDRDPRELASAATMVVTIPTDTLEILS